MLPNSRGFTLIELVMIVALLAALILLTVPSIQAAMRRSNLRAAARDTASLMQLARLEAIKRGAPAVVKFSFADNEVLGFVDLNLEDGSRGSDLKFTPIAGAPSRTSDYLLGRISLAGHGRVHFWGATDTEPFGANAIWQFTDVTGESENAAVFNPNGTVTDAGAVRFADLEGRNFLEVLVSPAASGRVQVRKYNGDVDPGLDGTQYFPPGPHPITGEITWVWE
ncbi:MAG: GspH/FimT family pseudopilin [Thermoanaerobaculia bacterium]